MQWFSREAFLEFEILVVAWPLSPECRLVQVRIGEEWSLWRRRREKTAANRNPMSEIEKEKSKFRKF